MKAFLQVRASVSNPDDRPGFDAWYRSHHLPLACARLKAEHAMRMWCCNDPSIHIALYRFPSLPFLEKRMSSEDLTLLLADFDTAWPHVTRTRELLVAAQELGG